jgi:hypothetical protein
MKVADEVKNKLSKVSCNQRDVNLVKNNLFKPNFAIAVLIAPTLFSNPAVSEYA